MSYDEYDDERLQEEREINHRLIWKCPTPGCGYEYESERFVNEACKCPDCGAITRNSGESYDSSPRRH